MIASERKRYILNELRKAGILSLKETAKMVGASEITIRRDFEKLEKEGKLKRVQGGVELEDSLENTNGSDGVELTMTKKIMLNLDEKTKIAQYAADFVKDGDCVFIDSGTTMLPLIDLIANKRIVIVTYSTLALRKLKNPLAEIIVLGGKYLPYYNMNTGTFAQDMLKKFYFDIAFIGCAGVDIEQRVAYLSETEGQIMKHIAMENAKRSFLLADSSKFGKRGFFKLSDFSTFEAVVCDAVQTDRKLPNNLIVVQ